jgi:hypothetical protein
MARWSRPDRTGPPRSRPPARRRATRGQRRREDRDRCATPDGPLDAQEEPGLDHSTASQGSRQRDPPPNLDLFTRSATDSRAGTRARPRRQRRTHKGSAAGAVGLLSAGSKPAGRRKQGRGADPQSRRAAYAKPDRGRPRYVPPFSRERAIQIVANHAPARASTKWRMRSRAPAGSGPACPRNQGGRVSARSRPLRMQSLCRLRPRWQVGKRAHCARGVAITTVLVPELTIGIAGGAIVKGRETG